MESRSIARLIPAPFVNTGPSPRWKWHRVLWRHHPQRIHHLNGGALHEPHVLYLCEAGWVRLTSQSLSLMMFWWRNDIHFCPSRWVWLAGQWRQWSHLLPGHCPNPQAVPRGHFSQWHCAPQTGLAYQVLQAHPASLPARSGFCREGKRVPACPMTDSIHNSQVRDIGLLGWIAKNEPKRNCSGDFLYVFESTSNCSVFHLLFAQYPCTVL